MGTQNFPGRNCRMDVMFQEGRIQGDKSELGPAPILEEAAIASKRNLIT